MPWPRAQIWGDTGLGLKPGLLSHWGVGRWRPQISNHPAVGWPSTLHTWLQLSWRQACRHASMDSSRSLSPVYFLPSICPDGGHLWALLTAQAAACLTHSHRLKTQPQKLCPSAGHPFQINCYSCFWSGLMSPPPGGLLWLPGQMPFYWLTCCHTPVLPLLTFFTSVLTLAKGPLLF